MLRQLDLTTIQLAHLQHLQIFAVFEFGIFLAQNPCDHLTRLHAGLHNTAILIPMRRWTLSPTLNGKKNTKAPTWIRIVQCTVHTVPMNNVQNELQKKSANKHGKRMSSVRWCIWQRRNSSKRTFFFRVLINALCWPTHLQCILLLFQANLRQRPGKQLVNVMIDTDGYLDEFRTVRTR